MLLDFLLSIKYHKSEKSFVYVNHFITMYKYIKNVTVIIRRDANCELLI